MYYPDRWVNPNTSYCINTFIIQVMSIYHTQIWGTCWANSQKVCHAGVIRIKLVCHWWHTKSDIQKQLKVYLFWHTSLKVHNVCIKSVSFLTPIRLVKLWYNRPTHFYCIIFIIKFNINIIRFSKTVQFRSTWRMKYSCKSSIIAMQYELQLTNSDMKASNHHKNLPWNYNRNNLTIFH